MGRKAGTNLLNDTGWKTRKHPAAGEVFFLTFPFIELTRSYGVFNRKVVKPDVRSSTISIDKLRPTWSGPLL
jgi:hypothetical protein